MITKRVLLLSLISFFTDVSSELLYPVIPLYLKEIGFSVLFIGILEGFAEATAGLSKGYFGKISDITHRRAVFVQVGYSLSALAKPMMVAFTYPLWVFAARTLDRLGKGIRTGARDALLSEEATVETKGKVFGFHRGMDTLGAVVGPVLGLVYLYFFPEDYVPLFLLSFFPGLLAVLFSFLVRDREFSGSEFPGSLRLSPERKEALSEDSLLLSFFRQSFRSFFRYWTHSPLAYKKVAGGLLVFSLVNSSDIFLLLKVKESGSTDLQMIGFYIFYNLVYAVFSYPMGSLADRLGLKKVLIFGLFLFSLVYQGMAWNRDYSFFFLLFFLYGLYSASVEGISRAWISNLVEEKDLATALGTFHGFQSICTMLASSLTSLLWVGLGASYAFLVTAVVTFLVAVYFLGIKG